MRCAWKEEFRYSFGIKCILSPVRSALHLLFLRNVDFSRASNPDKTLRTICFMTELEKRYGSIPDMTSQTDLHQSVWGHQLRNFYLLFISPTFDKPKSVSLMCPMDVIKRLQHRENNEKNRRYCVEETEKSLNNFFWFRWTYSWISWNSNLPAPWVDFEIPSVASTLSFVFKPTSEIWNSIPLFTALSQSDCRYLSFQVVVKHVHFSCSSFHIVALAFMEEFWGNLVGSYQLFLPLLFFKLFPILQ